MPRITRECPVEVHQMESRRALFLPEKRGSSRVVAVLGGASGVPFLEAHAFSALQVYCRNQLEIHLTALLSPRSFELRISDCGLEMESLDYDNPQSAIRNPVRA